MDGYYLNGYLTDCTSMNDNGGTVRLTSIINNATSKAHGYLVKPLLSSLHKT